MDQLGQAQRVGGLETHELDAQEVAHKDSVRLTTSELTSYLLDSVGQRITAVATGVADARPVRSWREGIPPREEHDWRLRLLYRVVRSIEVIYGVETAKAFLRSSNPQLDDRAPILVIADSSQTEGEPLVLAATRAFLEG